MPEIRQKLNLEVMAWNTGTGVHYGGTTPWPLKRGGAGNGTHVPLHNSIISSFMIYQDRLEINLLQLFAPTYSSEGFPIISVISFEVNITSEHVTAKRMTIMGALLHWTQANSIDRSKPWAFALPWKLRLGTKFSRKSDQNFLENPDQDLLHLLVQSWIYG